MRAAACSYLAAKIFHVACDLLRIKGRRKFLSAFVCALLNEDSLAMTRDSPDFR